MGPDRKLAWRCLVCKEEKAKRLKSQDVAAAKPGEDSTSNKQLMEVMVKKLEDMEKKLTNSYKDSEKKVSKKLEDFEATLSFYGDKIDEATKSVKAMEQKLVLMENRLDKSERENKELKTRLRNMEIQMNEIAQKQYNNQMEISGVKDKNINAEIATLVELLYRFEPRTFHYSGHYGSIRSKTDGGKQAERS
ncbi:hypothetical protein M8J76_013286 [Diaphorina citri]|nr:hypothetical protein M8J76_013286 [Diaphorina citri]